VKRVVLIVRASGPARVAEALRAALGLSLRGDRVEVILANTALPALQSDHAGILRAVATLEQLGHVVARGDEHMAQALRRAHAVEVWT
jgi:hypothetical protein